MYSTSRNVDGMHIGYQWGLVLKMAAGQCFKLSNNLPFGSYNIYLQHGRGARANYLYVWSSCRISSKNCSRSVLHQLLFSQVASGLTAVPLLVIHVLCLTQCSVHVLVIQQKDEKIFPAGEGYNPRPGKLPPRWVFVPHYWCRTKCNAWHTS
jgi:hypothetical protein